MTFEELPKQVRREVVRLAKARQQHPDAEIARTAYEWARKQPQSRLARTLDLVAELVSGVLAPGSGDLTDLRARLAARRIVRLGPPG
jgi:hypothetical protein